MIADGRYKLIAIHHTAIFVGQDQTVRITVQGNSHVRAVGHHLFAQVFRVGGTAFLVDVKAVRIDT